MTDREDYITGLRQLADWLTLNPDMPVPYGRWVSVALRDNDRVHAHAAQLDIPVRTDDEGNCSADLHFAGGLTYHAYGYADFPAHLEATDARNAQAYADRHNLTLTPKETTAA